MIFSKTYWKFLKEVYKEDKRKFFVYFLGIIVVFIYAILGYLNIIRINPVCNILAALLAIKISIDYNKFLRKYIK